MTRENIECMREVVLPFVKKKLLKINYENLGKSDAEEFEKHFNEILDLALKALEQEPILDKIRAEIEAEPYISKMEVLEIIDKYKTESGDNRCRL